MSPALATRCRRSARPGIEVGSAVPTGTVVAHVCRAQPRVVPTDPGPEDPGAEIRELYLWQLDALISWLRCGRRGVIEAVTGSGKTDVAIAAATDALRRGRFVLVVVPSRVLMEQWHGRLTGHCPKLESAGSATAAATARHPATCSWRPATRRPRYKPVPPEGAGGLLIADECHGLGGGTLRRAMLPQYDERLGLTATLERSDNTVAKLLVPYFGGICHRYGFEQAIDDGVCASPRVAFAAVELSHDERAEYNAAEQRLVSARVHLRRVHGMPLEPFGDFVAAVAHLAEHDAGADGRAGASTSTRSRSGARSWRSRVGSTNCSASSREPSGRPRARWCSPRPCAPRTMPSTGWILTCRST